MPGRWPKGLYIIAVSALTIAIQPGCLAASQPATQPTARESTTNRSMPSRSMPSRSMPSRSMPSRASIDQMMSNGTFTVIADGVEATLPADMAIAAGQPSAEQDSAGPIDLEPAPAVTDDASSPASDRAVTEAVTDAATEAIAAAEPSVVPGEVLAAVEVSGTEAVAAEMTPAEAQVVVISLSAPEESATQRQPEAAAGVPDAPAALAAPGRDSAPPPPLDTVAPVGLPYEPEVERWRPLVRILLAEAAAEGRLRGPARQLNEDLLLALITQESGGDETAESWAGAMGLMQLMPETFAELMLGDPEAVWILPAGAIIDPPSNVRAGIRYLCMALQVTDGDLYWALASYNAGVGMVSTWMRFGLPAVPPIGGYWETAAYAPAILTNYAAHRPDVQVSVPAPMDQHQAMVAASRLTAAGLW